MIKQFKKVLRRLYREAVEHIPALRPVLRGWLFRRRRRQYERLAKGAVTNPKQVVFCTFSGRGYSDSPRAIYERMRADPRFHDWEFVWVFRDISRFTGDSGKAAGFPAEDPRTRLVEWGTAGNLTALASAKYWVYNYRVQDHIFPRADQVYLECWHGTPLKRLGYDIEAGGNVYSSREEIRQKFDLDREKLTWLLSPSPFATERFISAWDLKAHHREDAVLEVGYPRNDVLVNAAPGQAAAIREGLGLGGKRVILYAPTWRDDRHSAREGGFTYTLGLDFERLRAELGEDYVVLFRAHYLVANGFDFAKYQGFVYNMSDYPDINDLYLAADLLVTDYSSVFFDYAILKKPILFYMYDLAAYRDEIRGFYLGLDELPGKIVRRQEELAPAIRDAMATACYDAKYQAFHDKFNPLEDGHAAGRVIEAMLRSGAEKEGTA